MVKAAVAESVDSGLIDVDLSSADDANSVSDLPLAVSSTSDFVDETSGTEESPNSVSGPTSVPSEVSLPQADLQNSSAAAADNNCFHASSVEGSIAVEKSVEDDVGSETSADDLNIPLCGDQTKDVELSTHATDDFRCHNDTSPCSELSSSLTESLDICEQGVIGSHDGALVSAADSDVDAVTVSAAPRSSCPPVCCHCSSSTSSDVENNSHSLGSAEFVNENTESDQCSCELEQSVSDLETAQLLLESAQQSDSDDFSPSDSKHDFTVSATGETFVPTSGDEDDAMPISSPNARELHPLTSTLSTSDVCQVTPNVGMETQPEAIGSSLPSTDVSDTLLALEPDCEPGIKASKLDRVVDAESLTSCDLESSDTGVLHMSVGFQSSPDSDKAAAFSRDLDTSHDSSIGILMVCDDDGLVSTISAVPSVIAAESCEDNGLELSPSSDGDYESLVVDTSPSSIAQFSDETVDAKWPSEVFDVCADENSTESSDALAVNNVMLYDVDSTSQQLNELLGDVSQNNVNISREAESSDTSMLSREDGELGCRVF